MLNRMMSDVKSKCRWSITTPYFGGSTTLPRKLKWSIFVTQADGQQVAGIYGFIAIAAACWKFFRTSLASLFAMPLRWTIRM